MLVALHQEERLIAPQLAPATARALSRDRALRCPGCRGRVLFRAGARVTPHFAHERDAACPASDDPDLRGESEAHVTAKLALWAWARAQGAEAELEAELPEAGRRADVLVRHGGRRLALEVQHSPLPAELLERRRDAYARAGVTDVWLCVGPPPGLAALPAVAARGLAASARLALRELHARLLARDGRLLLLFPATRARGLPGLLTPAGTKRGALVLASIDALAAHHARGDGTPFPRFPREVLLLSTRHVAAQPLDRCALAPPPLCLSLGEAHDAAHLAARAVDLR